MSMKMSTVDAFRTTRETPLLVARPPQISKVGVSCTDSFIYYLPSETILASVVNCMGSEMFFE